MIALKTRFIPRSYLTHFKIRCNERQCRIAGRTRRAFERSRDEYLESESVARQRLARAAVEFNAGAYCSRMRGLNLINSQLVNK